MGRSNNFDALRLTGALAVLVSHQFMFMGRDQPMIAGYTLGTIAVFVFFAISGYLVAGSWQSDPNLGRYLIRRMLRMGPGFVALMVLTIYGLGAFGITRFPDNPIPYVNGSLWTLPYEIGCYLVLAGLALVMPVRMAALISLAVLLLVWRSGLAMDASEMGLMFCAGVLLRCVPLKRPLVLLAGAAVAGYIAKNQPFAVILLTLPLASILLGVASLPALRSAGRFGDFSYGIYIYACPVQQLVVMWLGTDRPYWVMLAVSLTLTFTLAALSWHFVEAPALGLKSRLVRKAPQKLNVRTSDAPVQPVCPVTVDAVTHVALSGECWIRKSLGDELGEFHEPVMTTDTTATADPIS